MRIDTLDKLRVLSALLRCMLHALVPYLATRTGMWPFKEVNNSHLLPDVLVFNIHSFIMEAFYFLSGYLAWHQLRKHSIRYFVIERARRVLVPFLVGLVILVPWVIMLFPAGAQWESGYISWQPVDWWHKARQLIMENFYPTAHLWFLFYLLFFYLLCLAFVRIDLPKISNPFWPLVVCLPAMIFCYQWHAEWIIKNPLTTSIEWATFLYYGLFFGLGWVTAAQGTLWLETAYKYRWWMLCGWIILCVVAPWLQTFREPVMAFEANEMHLAATSAASLQTLMGLGAFTGLLHNNRSISHIGRFLVSSSYWVYLTHMPLVMVCQWLLLPVAMPLMVKFFLALFVSLALCFGSFQLFGSRLLMALRPAGKKR